jgi:two-component system sensor histidine kinase/response regulator
VNSLPSPSSGSTGSCVLVVDDIPKNLQVVGTMLRNAGYAIMPATSGAKALEGVRVQSPDLILLDLMMPEMDGLEVCRRLKADPLTQQIPVIFLTASNEMEHLVKGFEMGAVDYVTKPFNPPELLARVRTHLELKHARDTIVRYGQELSRLNEEKNEFMGIAAHDLRNPLGAIIGYSELVVEDARSLKHDDLDDNGRRIVEAASRMVEMVQNLLDANRIERGEMKLNLAPTDLCPLLNEVIETQRPPATTKQQTIHLEIESSPVVVPIQA